MGFGFNFFMIFILIPLTGILLTIWLLYRKSIFGKILGFMWLGIIGLVLFVIVVKWLTSKTTLEKDDYVGAYVINREYFKGKQTDWQYNHFRFEITTEDSIFFHVTEKEKIIETYRGTIKTTNPNQFDSERLIINMEQPTHHILRNNPTTYRSSWSFYLVFDSPQFYNVFFEKGNWEPID